METPSGSAPIVVSTDAFPRRDRFDAWRETFMLKFALVALTEGHVAELLANLIDPAAAPVREQRFGGIKAARLQAVVQGIERHLDDPGLSAARLVARLGLSERYVQHLLAEAGTGFTELVRRKRLERARRLLQAQGPRPQSIADIAYSVGLGDLSALNRAFRRHYGRTPSDMRRG